MYINWVIYSSLGCGRGIYGGAGGRSTLEWVSFGP